MATYKFKLFPSATLKAKVLPAIHSVVTATNGLQANKEGGVVTIEPDYGSLAVQPTVVEADRDFIFMPAWNSLTETHTRISVSTYMAGFADALVAIGELTPAADKFPYFTSASAAALASITTFGRSLVDDADASTALTTLGVSTFIKTMLDDADASTARSTLGAQAALGYTPVQQGTGTGQGSNAVKIGWTGTELALTVDSSDLGTFLLASHIGSTVQAFDADLSALAALSTTGIANRTGSNTWSLNTGTDNYVPKWSSNGFTGTSKIFDNGTTVGIGRTTDLFEAFNVEGTSFFQTTHFRPSGATSSDNLSVAMLPDVDTTGAYLVNLIAGGTTALTPDLNQSVQLLQSRLYIDGNANSSAPASYNGHSLRVDLVSGENGMANTLLLGAFAENSTWEETTGGAQPTGLTAMLSTTYSERGGSLFGGNFIVGAETTAALDLIAFELDFKNPDGSASTASTGTKLGLVINDAHSGSVTGTYTVGDASTVPSNIGVWLQGVNTSGWNHAFSVFAQDGLDFPVSSSGTLFFSGVGTVANGIDLNKTTITGNAFRSTNFFVNGSGQLTASALNCTNDLTVNGNSTLGNASSDTLTLNATVVGRVLAAPSGTSADSSYNGVFGSTRPSASGQHINLVRSGAFVWSLGYVYNTDTFAIGVGQATDSSFTSPAIAINTSSKVGIGATSNLTGLLNFPAADSGEVINIWSDATEGNRSGIGKYSFETRFYVPDSNRFVFYTGGPSGTERVRFTSSASYFPNIGTTASAANAFLDSGSSPANQLLRSTSSIKYKTDVLDLDEDEIDSVLKLRPVKYRSLAKADDKNKQFFGLIAEEVAEIEPRMVQFVDDEPDGVMYDRLVIPLLAKVRSMDARLSAIEGRA